MYLCMTHFKWHEPNPWKFSLFMQILCKKLFWKYFWAFWKSCQRFVFISPKNKKPLGLLAVSFDKHYQYVYLEYWSTFKRFFWDEILEKILNLWLMIHEWTKMKKILTTHLESFFPYYQNGNLSGEFSI